MTSSDYARMKKPCLSSHQKEQLKDGYITPHKTKLTQIRRTDKSPFFVVMREYNVVLGFFLVSSIFLEVCSTWTMYVPVETVNS